MPGELGLNSREKLPGVKHPVGCDVRLEDTLRRINGQRRVSSLKIPPCRDSGRWCPQIDQLRPSSFHHREILIAGWHEE
jgi:hypothetical protein